MAAVGGLAVAVMLTQAGHRVAVLAVARDVPVGAIVTADDLTIAHVSADPNLSPIRASEEGSIVGQVAAVDLTAGSLLTRSALNQGSSGLAAGQQLIGLPLKPGQMPARPLAVLGHEVGD
jgi:flagella basal body P-ring formation protein FlgA